MVEYEMFTLDSDSSQRRKKRKGRHNKKIIYIEGYGSCTNRENGAINSSHPSDGSLEKLYVNSYDIQAPLENNIVLKTEAKSYKVEEILQSLSLQQIQTTDQLIYIFKKKNSQD